MYESGGVYYVGQLVQKVDPDMSVYESQKDKIREQALAARREEFYQAWVGDLKSHANIQ